MQAVVRAVCVVTILLHASPVYAHPAPFSYLDLRMSAGGVTGTLVVHDLDAAHDLGLTQADALLDPAVAATHRDALVALLAPRVTLQFDGRPVEIIWGGIDVVPERQSVRLAFTVRDPSPAHVAIRAYVFPYDPIHQTFINLYEENDIRLQAIVDAGRQTVEYYAGTTQGRLAVVRTFVLSGIEHIVIGPDHILFLIGLLLLGGTIARLALIVTAFTIGHSITLSLAALDIVSPPSYFIEPLIALTIVVVGADNLLVLRAGEDKKAADIRAWLAAGFGLIHGFGFAYVLKEFGLPQTALAWSLFAFNVGVEIGQLLIVTVVAGSLMFIRKRSPAAARVLAIGGSVAVIIAGVYWFIERVFLT
jgi:hydrogenase/urease accessory protein HupE